MNTNGNTNVLLKDICARLPYGVKFPNAERSETVLFIDTSDNEVWINGTNINDFKPYLFPLSSMTEEQKEEFDQLIEIELAVISDEIDSMQTTTFEVDFYNKHHLDWRGLIPMGLAIDATGLNIY